eukprot:3893821-Ditylum_brightwellii.AAC.1
MKSLTSSRCCSTLGRKCGPSTLAAMDITMPPLPMKLTMVRHFCSGGGNNAETTVSFVQGT